ncbi:MAG: hypothetical protein GYA21_06700 [Myxococcales bacterium]|nr:hypothetical protein [Myxococcales bacterium]
MRSRYFVLAVAPLIAAVGCAAPTRAWIHPDDVPKVFPWPNNQSQVTVRAKPRTTLANTCSWFGSYEEVTLGPDTSFYITDELDKQFVYTPVRSPMRRLSPVKSIEIRWPVKVVEPAAAPPPEPPPAPAEPAAPPQPPPASGKPPPPAPAPKPS